MPVIPALREAKQEDYEFKASLDCETLSLKKGKKEEEKEEKGKKNRERKRRKEGRGGGKEEEEEKEKKEKDKEEIILNQTSNPYTRRRGRKITNSKLVWATQQVQGYYVV
jgi:hypothetical protein